MASVNYQDYVNSPAWAAKKAAFLRSDHRHAKRCYVCQRRHRRGWHVHHLTYQRLGYESFDDLTIACPDCHDEIHALHERAKLAGRHLTLQDASDEVRDAYLSKPYTMPTRAAKVDYLPSYRQTTRSQIKEWASLGLVLLILGLCWSLAAIFHDPVPQRFQGTHPGQVSPQHNRDDDRPKKPKVASPKDLQNSIVQEPAPRVIDLGGHGNSSTQASGDADQGRDASRPKKPKRASPGGRDLQRWLEK